MKEIYSGVDYYGIGTILREYSNFPNFLPLPIGIQHGWVTGTTHNGWAPNITHIHDVRYDAPENWFWTKEVANIYQKKFEDLNVRAMGAPFLYLLKNIRYSEPLDKKGSIVFPAHSSQLIEVGYDFDKYISMLQQLPDKYKPITICMYYLDLENGLDIAFREKGFEVIKNGSSLYDVNFLKNFVENVNGKKYAFSNQMTSALMFSSAMGLISFYYGPDEYVIECNDPYDNYYVENKDTIKKWENYVLRYFQFPHCDTKNQRQFALNELGENVMLSLSEMSEILYRCALSKKYICKLSRQTVKEFIRNHIPNIYDLYMANK